MFGRCHRQGTFASFHEPRIRASHRKGAGRVPPVSSPSGHGKAHTVSTLVSSLFRSRASAEYAVVELVKAGFSPKEISLLALSESRFVGSGPIADALSGFDPDAGSGALALAFATLGLPDHEARTVERAVGHGRILVGVVVDDDWSPGAERSLRNWNREELEEVEHFA